MDDPRRYLPAVDVLLSHQAMERSQISHRLKRRAVRELLACERRRLGQEDAAPLATDQLVDRAIDMARSLAASNAPSVFNLTGTVIHTNLGRAPLAEPAIEAMTRAARYSLALEYDIDSGHRGDRDQVVESLLCELTGAEAATVVNNNAAAVVLTLSALGAGREAVISRGELIEIGGSFRLPDIMHTSGCYLREVGTTNRTHARDFEQAMNDATGMIFKAHTSNYAVEGFTAVVEESELARIAHAQEVPFIVDLGSGALTNMAALGLPDEARPRQSIEAGADVVTFSGDKLLGGPQCGLIVGSRDYIDRIRRHPLKRALRVDKLIMSALEATLRLYRDSDEIARDIPTLALLTRAQEDIAATAERLLPVLSEHLPDMEVSIAPCKSQLGSGALPVDRLPSQALVVAPTTQERRAGERTLRMIETAFRQLPRPVIGRLHDGAFWLDLRCLQGEAEEHAFAEQLGHLSLNRDTGS
ncbi:L-seryl-tRNA(Sec) selenium transferase [Kushneria marisflavi]|uniref:L-seryl-tRNA(Sec) selenium transferase n=1 Tax=Kushneria marisflavi TaxID=157779 RepID=A0A240UR36_9GAMM|nr:L-seryl-tRNA(Sec) selenium transferase [Kushneria marisflavi]ART63502.1 L-seryl-tRNA(Sec) selenium transferase [Kushneria marisflavi]RKD84569.1 L-seryl-tRNA(Sec) selenium transferase [Kushneria marisflavi]